MPTAIANHLLLASAFENTYRFFAQGGFFMILILILSVVALTIIIWRGLALRFSGVLPPAVQQAIEQMRPGTSVREVREIVLNNPSPLSRVIQVLFAHAEWQRSEASEAVQTRARHEVARLETGLVILEIATGVAPLLGLLGTLSGLVGVFANLGDAGDPTMVARGIAEALNTTIMGLGVAAPSLVAYNYYMRKVEMISVEMESTVGDLMEKLYTTAEH